MLTLIRINHFLAFALPLVLGTFVLTRGPKLTVNRVYYLLCIFIAGYGFGNFSIHSSICQPMLGYRLAILFAGLQAPTLLLFSWFFPKRNHNITKKHIILIYLIAICFAALSFSQLYLQEIKLVEKLTIVTRLGPAYSLFACFFLFFSAMSAANLLKSYFTLKNPLEKVRSRYFLVGLFIAYIIGITFSLIMPVFGNEKLEYLGPIGPNIFVIFSTYAIVKHRLMDISLIIRKSLVYSLIIGLFTGIYISAIFLFGQFLQEFSGGALLLTLTSIILFAIAFQPLKNYLQTYVDRIFFKDKYNYQKTLKELSQAAAAKAEVNDLRKLVGKTIVQRLKIKNVSIFVIDKNRSTYSAK